MEVREERRDCWRVAWCSRRRPGVDEGVEGGGVVIRRDGRGRERRVEGAGAGRGPVLGGARRLSLAVSIGGEELEDAVGGEVGLWSLDCVGGGGGSFEVATAGIRSALVSVGEDGRMGEEIAGLGAGGGRRTPSVGGGGNDGRKKSRSREGGGGSGRSGWCELISSKF